MIRLLIILILLSTTANANTFSGVTLSGGTDVVAGTCADGNYTAPVGDGYAAVGNSDGNRNSYRGFLWVGETKGVCSGEVHITVSEGDVSSVTYKVSVWSVDPSNDLELVSELESITFSGSSLVDGAFHSFEFDSEVTLTTGCTVLLLSRNDPSIEDNSNFIAVRQNYTGDNKQWNVHYYDTGVLAGRGVNDEDQPEHFSCDWVIDGYDKTVASSTEYPDIPEDVTTSSASATSILIEWDERGENGVTIDYYNIYYYNTGTAALTLVDTSETTSYTDTGLTAGTYTYVVTAVSTSAKEGYHSSSNSGDWQTTLP